MLVWAYRGLILRLSLYPLPCPFFFVQVSSFSFNKTTTLLASAQTGPQSVDRVWRYQKGKCLAMFRTHVQFVFCLR